MAENQETIQAAQPKFDICIVNFNTKELTSACLKYLLNATAHFDCDIWVVDNGSSDGSLEMLEGVPEINLISRKPMHPEEGHTAHAVAIDLVFNKTNKPYLLLMHTDTIIYDAQAITMLLNEAGRHNRFGAVGCLDQVYHGSLAAAIKKIKKGISRQKKSLAFLLGLRESPPSNSPPPVHIRSFFSLWNIGSMKDEGLCFNMCNMNPGYAAQNEMTNRNYSFITLPAKLFFRHLDHLEAATVAGKNPYHFKHRKSKKFQQKLRNITGPKE